LLLAAAMTARTIAVGLLLAALPAGCQTSNKGLVGDASSLSDGDPPVAPERPAPPPIVPNLDASPAPDDGPPASPDAGPPAADATAGGTTPADAAPGDAAATMPPPNDARPSPDLAATVDTAPAPVIPAGCGIVSCDGVATRRDCCRAWYFFGLDSEDRNQTQRDGLVTSFTKGADIRATYAFDRAGQDGAVGVLLDRPRRLTSVRVTSQFGGAAAEAPFVTAEGANGSAGCGYALTAGGLADLARPLFCWGSRAVLPDRINVRIQARGPGPANIRVTAMQVQ
jgi:hypothetical protein